MKVLLELRHFTCIVENVLSMPTFYSSNWAFFFLLQTADMLELETVFYVKLWQRCAYTLWLG